VTIVVPPDAETARPRPAVTAGNPPARRGARRAPGGHAQRPLLTHDEEHPVPTITADQISALYDATVVSSTDGKIGSVGNVYLDDDTQAPSWVTVKTGLFGTSESFVPLADATLEGDEIRVSYSKDQVKDAPRLDTDAELSPEEEERLYSHYGVGGASGVQGGSDGGGLLTSGRTAQTTTTAGSAGSGTGESVGSTGDFSGTGGYSSGENGGGVGTGTGTTGAATGGTAAGVGTAAAAGTSGTTGEAGTAGTGHDTSGPNTDDAMTRSEEHASFGTQTRESGRARLRKHVVTERVTQDVPVSHEEVVVEREPITDANRGDAYSGGDLTEEEHEVTLHEERPVVEKDVEAVERVRLGTETVTDTERVSTDVRREEIEVDGDATTGTTGTTGTDRR
jgi:uncharacterized protein (TIGR02271 family)